MDSFNKILESILSKKRVGNHYEYLVKWKNKIQTQWVAIDKLYLDIEKICEFESRNKGKQLKIMESISKSHNRSRLKKLKLKKEQHPSFKGDDNNIPLIHEVVEGKMIFIEGDLTKDTPLRVIEASILQNQEIILLVEWKVKSDGTTPRSSFCSSSVMKRLFPVILAEFYESRIKQLFN